MMRNRLFFRLKNSQGQSTVEYLVVCFSLVASLIAAPSIYSTISTTMANKYKSYAFGIAISEPPSKSFDDKVEKTASVIHTIRQVFDAIGNLIDDLLGISKGPAMPATDAIKKFIDTLKNIFSKK